MDQNRAASPAWIAGITIVPAVAMVSLEQNAARGYNALSRRRYG